MAEKIFQPILSGTGTPTYINPGVQDRSSLAGLADVFKAGADMYSKYQENKLIPQVEGEIKKYEEAYQGQKEGAMAGAVATQEAGLLDKFWEDARTNGQDEKDNARIDPVEASYQAHMEKFANAKKQGKISEQELLARINQVTREAVTKNPWLEQQLYARANAFMRNSGISDLLTYREKTEAAKAKSMAEEYDFYKKQMFERDLGYEPGMTIEDMIPILNKDMKFEKTIDATEKIRKGQVAVASSKWEEVLSSGQAYESHMADMTGFAEKTLKTLSGITDPKDYAAAITAAKIEAAQRPREWARSLGSMGTTEGGKGFIKSVEEDYKNMLEVISKGANGEESATLLKNHLEMKKAEQELKLRKDFDVPRLQLAAQVAVGLGVGQKQAIAEAGGDVVTKMMSTILHMVDPQNTSEKVLTNDVISGESVAALGTVMERQQSMYPESDAQALTSGITEINRVLSNPNISDTQRAMQANAFLAQAAKGIPLMGQTRMPPQFSTEVKKTVDIVMKPMVNDLSRMLHEANVKVPDANLHIDALPNGTFIISGDNPDLVRRYNEKFSTPLNNALDAFAVSSGIPKESAAKQFYGEYFGAILEPLNQGVGTNPSTTPAKPAVANPSASEAPSKPQEATFEALPIERLMSKPSSGGDDTPAGMIKAEFGAKWEAVKADKNLTKQQKADKASELWAQMKAAVQGLQ